MSIKVIVFDFDGTLVKSNELKYNAFFKIFPKEEFYQKVIKDVLAKIGDKSRYTIIREVLHRVNDNNNEQKINALAENYNKIVLLSVKKCQEKEGASYVLKSLKNYNLYLSSITPEEVLKEIVEYKGWNDYFENIFGYPRKKVDTIREIICTEGIDANELLVVGDGENDRISAVENNCNFFYINGESELLNLIDYLEKGKY